MGKTHSERAKWKNLRWTVIKLAKNCMKTISSDSLLVLIITRCIERQFQCVDMPSKCNANKVSDRSSLHHVVITLRQMHHGKMFCQFESMTEILFRSFSSGQSISNRDKIEPFAITIKGNSCLTAARLPNAFRLHLQPVAHIECIRHSSNHFCFHDQE